MDNVVVFSNSRAPRTERACRRIRGDRAGAFDREWISRAQPGIRLQSWVGRRLVADGRSFVTELHYNMGAESALASATLTNCDGSAPLLFVVHAGIEDSGRYHQVCDPSVPVWLWNPSSEAMPPLLPRQPHHPRAAESAVECR